MPFSVTNPDFVPGTLMKSSEIDQNFADLVSQGNTHEAATTAVHGVGGGAIVGTTLTQTLTNKTLTAPKINDTSSTNQYVVAVNELTANRTITLPLLTGNDTFVFNDFSATLTNKTLGSGTAATFPGWFNNISIVKATTTNTNDSIKITSADGTALSATNIGTITLQSTVTAGLSVKFSITADVTILLTGAHWGIGTTGDITGALLRVLAINDTGTLRWGVAYLGGRNILLTTDTNATQTNITAPEYVLCTAAVSSAQNTCREIGFVRANFDDTGGAAEDLWAIQTGAGDTCTGITADGFRQPWNPVATGFAGTPTTTNNFFVQTGRLIHIMGSVSGTSNAVGFSITGPGKSAFGNSGALVYAVDNGAVVIGYISYTSASQTITFGNAALAGAWTNVSAKQANYMTFYQVGPSASFID